jgi:hypothetical protein
LSDLPLDTGKRKRPVPSTQKSITNFFSAIDTTHDTPSPSHKRRQLDQENKDSQGVNPSPDNKDESLEDKEDLLLDVLEDNEGSNK